MKNTETDKNAKSQTIQVKPPNHSKSNCQIKSRKQEKNGSTAV